MRVGLIGYGAWGSIHAAALASLDRHRLVAIASRTDTTASRAQREHPDVEVLTSIDALLERPDIDAVDIALPTHLHVSVAEAALAAGKHVLLEKPMATSVEACDRLVEAAQQSRGVLSLVHELRLSDQWRSVREAIEQGAIGTPMYGMFNLFRFPYRQGAEAWRYDAATVGSWILEEPIHFFDLLLWYFEAHGAPTRVSAFGTSSRGKSALTENFTAVVEFASGAYAVISQSLGGFEHHQLVEIAGSEGSVRSLWSGAMDRTDRPEFSVRIQRSGATAPEAVHLDKPSGELFEIREWIALALDGFERGEALYPPEQERELVRLCLAAEEAIGLGRPLDLTGQD